MSQGCNWQSVVQGGKRGNRSDHRYFVPYINQIKSHQLQGNVLAVSGLKLPWWRHQMETFSALLAICARNSPVPGDFPAQRPVTLSFDVFLDLRLNKRLSKQPWGWWFETPSWSLWHQCNGMITGGRRYTASLLLVSIWVHDGNDITRGPF